MANKVPTKTVIGQIMAEKRNKPMNLPEATKIATAYSRGKPITPARKK